jgi:WD40 repeat protein
MARIQRHHRAIAGALLGLVALVFAPAFAEDQGRNAGTDLYDRPVLAIDPGMHTAAIGAQAVDASEHYAVTGGLDRNVRVWSVADGSLLKTIWIPVGPNPVGIVTAVAISGDGSTIAVGGITETLSGEHPIYVFDRETGTLIRRIRYDLFGAVANLKFSPDGRFLAAAMVGGKGGLRIFDRTDDWNEAFRDDAYESYGVSFARDGRLATASLDAKIRLYEYSPDNIRPTFRAMGDPVRITGGLHPYRIAFSPDGSRLAVGFGDGIAVDVLDGATLQRLGGHAPTGLKVPSAPMGPFQVPLGGLSKVAWSIDGLILFATGAVVDVKGRSIVLAWDRSGLGDERRLPDCGDDTPADVNALPSGRVFVASMEPCLGLLNADGAMVWSVQSQIIRLYAPLGQNAPLGQIVRGYQNDRLKVSQDGRVVDFRYGGSVNAFLRFDMRSLDLSPAPSDVSTYPSINGPVMTTDANHNTCVGPIQSCVQVGLPNEYALSGAIAPDGKTYFIGTNLSLNALDKAGPLKWHWVGPDEVLAVNVSKDNRLVIAAYGDGTIRWHRADDGRELLALQVLSNEKDWVLWTPEGFYEATAGAQDVLKWVVNHGPDKAATTLPVSAIPRFHRPEALPHVLDEMETAHALGVDDMTQARLDVQAKTGSAKPPGGVLHVLSIGVDKFGDKASGLHLDYAAEDAHDVATALQESQKLGPGKASLYADVKIQYLPNDQADNTAIRDALDNMASSMTTSGSGQDVAVILVSSHGEMIDGQFYLVPYGVDVGSKNKIIASALSASDFAEKVQAIAAHGKVLLLLDACHSGAVRPGGWATDPDAKILRDVLNMDNVTVLTSSDEKGLSEELPTWRHGALAQAFLDALTGAGDSNGIIRLTALISQMDGDLRTLTQGRQSLGQHANFGGDLFMASHY